MNYKQLRRTCKTAVKMQWMYKKQGNIPKSKNKNKTKQNKNKIQTTLNKKWKQLLKLSWREVRK